MKHYPTEILLTVTEPKTGQETMRWFPVKNEQHEKFTREQNQNARKTIAEARKRMAEAVGAPEQKLVVESLKDQFVEFYRREDTNGRLDVGRGQAGEKSGDEGLLHADSGQERPDSASGSGSGQEQGRESGQESSDGAGIRESSGEPIAVETN